MRIDSPLKSIFLQIILLFCLIAGHATAGEIITDRLSQKLDITKYDKPLKVWVYLIDKDTSQVAYQKAAASMTERARLRRSAVRGDQFDLPVNPEYVAKVRAVGGEQIRISRWLNAVSCYLYKDLIVELAVEEFISKIDLVASYIRYDLPDYPEPEKKALIDTSIYGPSFTQIQMLGIDSLHKTIVDSVSPQPLDGSGVLIAFLDTGYLTSHSAFNSMSILQTWDFINDDESVNDNLPDGSQTGHGTATLSACGGFAIGELIGPAYGSDYILAKTEIMAFETPTEEDHWVLAAQWADSLGADIISSSLGYYDWYSYDDMDGNTAVTTIAAGIAASRGILVVTSAGNEGNKSWHYIIAPADGDSVLSIGAVNAGNTIADFSSYGPTFDGRIKPEVVALGVGVRCASVLGGFAYRNGTSLSAPLIAGAAALFIQANPSFRGRPYDIRQRILESSDRFSAPDNHYGYGLPDMITAVHYGLKIIAVNPIMTIPGAEETIQLRTLAPSGVSVVFDAYDIPPDSEFVDHGDGTATLTFIASESMSGPKTYHIAVAADLLVDTLEFTVITYTQQEVFTYGPNPFTSNLTFNINPSFSGDYSIEIFTIAGELVFDYGGNADQFVWKGINQSGKKAASGVYIIRFFADGIDERIKVFKL